MLSNDPDCFPRELPRRRAVLKSAGKSRKDAEAAAEELCETRGLPPAGGSLWNSH